MQSLKGQVFVALVGVKLFGIGFVHLPPQKLVALQSGHEARFGKGEWDQRLPGALGTDTSQGGDPLIVPLPHQAVQVLREIEGVTGGDGFVFPSLRGKGRPMSENTVNAALHRLGYKDVMTAHGFRAMARTVLVEQLGYPIEYVEMQLAHSVRNPLGRAYNRPT